MPTHYEVLNVPPTASSAEIRAAYLGLARKLHPDRNPHPEAEAVMRIVNDSYQVLGDPEARASYDETLFATPYTPGPDWWDGDPGDTAPATGAVHGKVGLLTVLIVVALIVIVIASAYAGPVTTRP
jgi:curved DNA-binding protein CbpA